MSFLYLVLGLASGIVSGLLGIGGGTIIIPALIYLFKFTQHQAQGTSLAVMIPPIGLLAALKYYYEGNVNIKVAGFVCLGFFLGGLIGAILAHHLNDISLKKIFGIFLLIIALKMIFER